MIQINIMGHTKLLSNFEKVGKNLCTRGNESLKRTIRKLERVLVLLQKILRSYGMFYDKMFND